MLWNKEIFLLLLSVSIHVIYGVKTTNTNPRTKAVKAIQTANLEFVGDVYNVVKETCTENFVFSPFSLSSILAMLSAGAKGQTAEEIRRGLNLQGVPEESIYDGYQNVISSLQDNNEDNILETANRIYTAINLPVEKTFMNIVRNNFFASDKSVDFGKTHQTTLEINNWVSETTQGKINNLIGPGVLNRDTKSVLVNAIYFKGAWKNQFNSAQTAKGRFYTSENDYRMIDKMRRLGFYDSANIADLGAKALSIPYKGDRLSLVIVMPKERTGFNAMESLLKDYPPSLIVSKLRMGNLEIKVPKFKLESKFDLVNSNILGELGMKTLTQKGSADFSGITKESDLYISEAIQKAFFEVNELGTEAAAATYVEFTSYSSSGPPEFDIDRPFIAFIYDNETKSVLFVARIVK